MTDPPSAKEPRSFRRFALFASVKLQLGEETLVLAVRNLSLGGALLATERDLRADLPVGSERELRVFDAANEERQPARVIAQVVRHDESGFAVRFVQRDILATIRLTLLFKELGTD